MADNRYMTVIKIHEDQSRSLECIDLYDVDFIETDKSRRIVFHIGEHHYYQIVTKADLDSLLVKEGFDILDRTNLVNLRKVRKFDKEYGKVYFEEHPTSFSKYTTVARIKYKFIADILKKIISHNNDTTTEITINKQSFAKKFKELFN